MHTYNCIHQSVAKQNNKIRIYQSIATNENKNYILYMSPGRRSLAPQGMG